MEIDMWPTFIPIIGNLLDKIFPDQQAAADAKLKLLQLAQTGELAELDANVKIAASQADINKSESQSANLFVAGWRPFIGWICGTAFAFKFIIGPLASVIAAAFGHPITLPNFDYSEMSTILLGMLGLGGLRTIEKVKGAA